ncbi:glycoside hydrolase family 19 protein [Falsiroseomonas sp. HW251]|uniref:glycoside hydrolase family 19 protein n=1 Tax=Falsiroseomonas sp. HW251 TaxID=3390998 RepID=UPI003D32069A
MLGDSVLPRLARLSGIKQPMPLGDLAVDLLLELQRSLAILGYPVRGVDGKLGNRTRNAWSEFKARHFPGNPDLVGPESVAKLQADVATLPSMKNPAQGDRAATIAAIRAECQAQGLGLPTQVAYVLATTQWETARTFQPVRETFWKDEAWRKANLAYYPYYGRGFVQLTWDTNYRIYGEMTGLDLLAKPDLAMAFDVALFVLVHGFKTGAFTGRKLTDFINDQKADLLEARRCINGMDKALEISQLAKSFL